MSEDLLRTNHVGFTVAALEPVVAMFRDLFGYAVESLGGRDPRGVARLTGVEGADVMVAHLRRPGFVGIELIQYLAPADQTKVVARPCDTGFAHLTFDCRRLDAFIARAAAFGLMPVGCAVGDRDGSGTSQRVVYLREANGIVIELIQPPFAQAPAEKAR